MALRTKDPSTALGKTATKGVAWSFLRESVSELLLFPASMLMARLLTPDEFGIAAAANFFTLLAGRLSELGFNAALVRSKEIKPIHLSTVFVVNLVLGVLSFALLVAISPLVGDFYGTPEPGQVLPIAALAFLIGPFGAVPAAILAREMQYQKATVVDWAQLTAFSLVGLLLAWSGFSYMSMVYARLAASCTSVTFRIWFARWRPSVRFSWPALREILSFGAGVHAKRLLDYAAQQGDNVLVGKFMGMTALGLYDKAFSTMDRFLSRMGSGPGVVFRIFAVIHEEPDRFRRAYQKVMMSASLVGFPVFAGLFVAAPQVMTVLFGEQWLSSVTPFRLLCLAGALKLLNTYASSVIQATGQVWSEVWRQVLLIAMIGGGIVTLRAWGPTGAAMAVLVATGVMSILMHTLLRRISGLRWSDIGLPLAPAALCAFSVAAVAFGIELAFREAYSNPSPVALLLVQVLAAGIAAAMFVVLAPFKDLKILVRDVTKNLAPSFIRRQPWARTYWMSVPNEGKSAEL